MVVPNAYTVWGGGGGCVNLVLYLAKMRTRRRRDVQKPKKLRAYFMDGPIYCRPFEDICRIGNKFELILCLRSRLYG